MPFQEYNYLTAAWMKVVTAFGLVIVIIGVAVSSRSSLPFELPCLKPSRTGKVTPS